MDKTLRQSSHPGMGIIGGTLKTNNSGQKTGRQLELEALETFVKEKAEAEAIDLSSIPTKYLVEELKTRPGVEHRTVMPHDLIRFTISGPAIVLEVID